MLNNFKILFSNLKFLKAILLINIIFIKALSVDELIFPTPNKIFFSNQTYIFNKNCKIKLLINSTQNNNYLETKKLSFRLLNKTYSNFNKTYEFSYLNEIISMYEKVINRQFYSASKHDKKYSNYCNIETNINIKNFEIKKFDSKYLAEYESYSLDLKIFPKKNAFSSFLINQTVDSQINIYLESLFLNGLIRGLETLSQIIIYNQYDSRNEIYNLPISINDSPEYAYRGVMIDTSRHFLSIKKIKKIIDGMLHSKLNVLHWHITDDEYFGFGTNIGVSYSDSKKYLYCKKKIKEILEYAFIRGITIIPEIDNPSHTRSWKDLNNIQNLVITKSEYGTLDPSKNETYNLVHKLISEMSQTFSINSQSYIHLGGDEVLSEMWSSISIQEFMKENNLTNTPELENYYFNRVRSLLPSETNYIYWISNQAEKFYDVFDKTNSVMMYWGLLDKLKNYLDSFPKQDINRTLIMTPADYVYLDCGSGNKYGDGTWCGDYKTWKTIFNIPIFKSYKNFRILGSQVVLFGELGDEQSVLGKIFPRACSLAERLWSKEKIDIKAYFVKLIYHNRRLNSRGIPSFSFTTQLCENKPKECLDNII